MCRLQSMITNSRALVKHGPYYAALMRASEIVDTVDAASFFAAPRHPYARQLLAAIPTFAKRGKPLSEPNASTATNAFSNPLAAPALNTGTQALLRVDK